MLKQRPGTLHSRNPAFSFRLPEARKAGPVSRDSSFEAPLVDTKESSSSLDEPGGTPHPIGLSLTGLEHTQAQNGEWRISWTTENSPVLVVLGPFSVGAAHTQMTLLKLFYSLIYRVHTSLGSLGRQTFGFHPPNSSPSPDSAHGTSLAPSQHPSQWPYLLGVNLVPSLFTCSGSCSAQASSSVHTRAPASSVVFWKTE